MPLNTVLQKKNMMTKNNKKWCVLKIRTITSFNAHNTNSEHSVNVKPVCEQNIICFFLQKYCATEFAP